MARFALLLVLLALLVACARAPSLAPPPHATPGAAGTPAALPSPSPARESWEEVWEKTVKAAQKEGTVIVYSATGATVRQGLAGPFKAKYGISVESISTRGGEVAQKLFAERRAGLYLADVIIGGATTAFIQLKPAGVLAPLDPALILPDVTEPERIKKLWWEGRLPWLDSGHFMLGMCAYPTAPLAINTNLVKPGEIKSYKDLLDPKWKGKIVMDDPTAAGSGSNWFSAVATQFMDLDFMNQLAKQEPFISPDRRLKMEWLAHGKYSILIAPHGTLVEFIRAGAPIQQINVKEGTYLTTGGAGLNLLDKAAHPDAAKVFINWLLTKEGQTLLSQSYGKQSSRLDVTTEGLEPAEVREPGARYYNSNLEEEIIKAPEMFKLAEKIFAPVMKR